MPAISKIRLTNVQYEEGNKRYNDELFLFDGHNGAILLENGGGKTVLIQTALQAILPHVDFADRKIKSTLQLENAPAHIAIEWIYHDQPRRYVVTAVSLFMTKNGLDSYRYVYEYAANDPHGIEAIPFTKTSKEGKRPADRGEIQDYYTSMKEKSFYAKQFSTIKDYKSFLQDQYHIITSEWERIVKINSTEGGVEAFFDECKSTNQLFDRLLIPIVESSIVGHDEKLFANMFDRQQASLKNYKKLKETLEENKQIQAHLEGYAKAFEKLNKLEKEYSETKQNAKGLWNEIVKQKHHFSKEHSNCLEMTTEWKQNKDFFELKKASYAILIEETKLRKLDEEFKATLAEFSKKEEEYEQHTIDYHSIKLADKKQMYVEQNTRLNQLEKELASFDQDDEYVEWNEQLEEKKRALLGCFLTEIEKYEKEIKLVTYELNPISAHIEKITESKKELIQQEKKLRETISETRGQIKFRLKEMEALKQFLVANPTQEDVKVELTKWHERYQFLDEHIIRLLQEEKQLELEKNELENLIEQFQAEFSTIEKEREKRAFQLDEIKTTEKTVIERLATVRTQWASVETIFLQEDSIKKRLDDEIEKKQKERDTLLYKERLAYRFVDDYSKQDQFFSDPYLEEQLLSLKNKVDYVVTGVEFLENLNEAERNNKLQYPLWPVTLVTTTNSKQKLIDRLVQMRDHLQFPISVLTTEEAVLIHETTDLTWVAPSLWEESIDKDIFSKWKMEIEKNAKKTTDLRIQKELEIKSLQEVSQDLHQFLLRFPFSYVSQLKELLSKSTYQAEELNITIQKKKETVKDLCNKIHLVRNKIIDQREEKQGLEAKIEKAMKYLQYAKEVVEEEKKEEKTNEKLNEVLLQLAHLDRELHRYNEEKNELKERLTILNNECLFIKRDDQFQSVQALTPIFTKESKRNVLDRIRDLELKIRKINDSHGELLAKRDGLNELISQLNREITELRNEHPNIDENREYPVDGYQLLEKLKAKIIFLENELKHLQENVKQATSKKDLQKGKLDSKVEQFFRDFKEKEIYRFTHSLQETKLVLDEEEQKLGERKVFLDQEQVRISKELRNVEEAERGLDRFDEGHHFLAREITISELQAEDIVEFTYNRTGFVKKITDELASKKQKVELEKDQVVRAKRKFHEFCSNHISDMKLRQMATTGIELKQTYEDILDFKKNMSIRIEKISNYANEHIRKSDEDLQLFISQIHTHLLTVVDELNQIPKRTRVKVEDDWKQIFTITIPHWQEEVGKTRIRDYVEWILEQLETDRFKASDGSQDEGKARKEIETWLQSKQLLRTVLSNEVMKVSCRKVTNDNKVSTRSYSWEQSNIWSGGEKWSKNMTLFLGILNYVAEKKHHSEQKTKRHRAVILDNPFGKASSDHVLHPVFFVAEQLGFQIIALTAHAEGKFLQDYFPVIYSCRLRGSSDSTKKVMTKEKWLHHAYFQDHEPKTIERLGETEQLALFE